MCQITGGCHLPIHVRDLGITVLQKHYALGTRKFGPILDKRHCKFCKGGGGGDLFIFQCLWVIMFDIPWCL